GASANGAGGTARAASPIVVEVAAPSAAVARPRNGANGNGNGQAARAEVDGPLAALVDVGGPRPGTVTLAPVTASPTVWPLVNAFRSRGHLAADLDPLGLVERVQVSELDPHTWGFTPAMADTDLSPTGVHGLEHGTLRQIVEHLRDTYCGTLALEQAHIDSPNRRTWLAQRMETRRGRPPEPVVRRRVLEQLINAETFERFCHVKYPGTKRFSLEGSEALIPMLDLVLTHGARLGAIEAVIGMAHRGRLTALEQIMQRRARDIFAEFEDIEPEAMSGGGDVKYHLGYSCDRVDPLGNAMHLSLAFNPSHLEAVDPVVMGRVRAKQKRHHDVERHKVMGVLVHGDGAFAGQGLVPEVLNLTNLAGYRTGGTIHIVVNNQVGFTASPIEQRSTPYCTDVAHMIQCPIWHVNGDDLDACAQVVEMAMDYRAQYASDVVIDLYCYRKYGHNEMDEPSFTQPVMYDRIQHKESVVELYGKRLLAEGVVTADDIAAIGAARTRALEVELGAAKAEKIRPKPQALTGLWRGYVGGPASAVPDVDTGMTRELLGVIAERSTRVPAGFTPHPKIVRLLEQRAQMGRGERPLDWGMGELLAYGALLWEGHNVRLTGQDCARGTFSHRHAMVADMKTGAEHLLLGELHPDQGTCRIHDSPLSEAAVLGFEFGYSLDFPEALVMWEAQFGDFANGAQVIIDQFITSTEDKWKRLSGLVLLLPHGYEGQGPEHSSARLERYLQQCAEDNIQVCQPTTPAQMFHLLRRQVKRPWRKPLVVMTPKSLLRLPAATSTLDELTAGTFQRLLPDRAVEPAAVKRLLLCSGKIYYELAEERRRRKDAETAIVRFEQLYPYRGEHVEAVLAGMAPADVAWVQDEPSNMGAACFILPRLERTLGRAVRLVSRVESASPATGSHKAHVMEQEQIFHAAFEGK
ncbi:MAG TPA: 2-oxoglutarate dehydrogenase E1 component, partial [Kofleriaceae bacterium]|nr:2-oxoglutarate dehydrogenase E1 component [Kofleriaceae bacterium]